MVMPAEFAPSQSGSLQPFLGVSKPVARVLVVEAGVEAAHLLGEDPRENALETRRHHLAAAGIAAVIHIRRNSIVGIVDAEEAGWMAFSVHPTGPGPIKLWTEPFLLPGEPYSSPADTAS